ncbi:peptidoglycan glycosyltransferase [[Clostridium] polysaccharolyticum]|uniref:Peptidoglycan glycosyltransferase n=2 Tax=[Clostridium] polysaccharolyticum TaxID=29364 RepID=A0A1I0B415_9FIRM|nr:peptidoglycan glycosyltransferase [[Clostridium] polysaccharolyticum]
MAGRYIYFMIAESPVQINNSYNRRQDLLAEKYVRGKILASDGTVLAQTVTGSDGKEKREYPYGQVFSHVVGSVGRGKTGLELAENFTMLSSHINVISQAITQMQGNKIVADDIVTTLNIELQKVAYEALGNRKGAAVAIEPATGRILAMVSKPSYDPNTIAANWDSLVSDTTGNSTLLNRATQGLYAPGSTFKIVSLLEYLKEHPDDYESYTYECKGSAMFGDRRISCYNDHVHGKQNLKESLANSCNDSFAHIGTVLNLKSYKNTAEKLMFNKSLSLRIPYNKSSFSLSSKDSLNEIAQTAMGQGKTQITPLQSALISSAIASQGKMMRPYIVEKVQTSTGYVARSTKAKVLSRSMTKKQASIVKEYMEEVVNHGTGTALKNRKYQVAGKTGSAEYDSTGASHAWFTGFAPANDPKIAVSIIVESSGTGSEYAVPIAKKMFESYLN